MPLHALVPIIQDNYGFQERKLSPRGARGAAARRRAPAAAPPRVRVVCWLLLSSADTVKWVRAHFKVARRPSVRVQSIIHQLTHSLAVRAHTGSTLAPPASRSSLSLVSGLSQPNTHRLAPLSLATAEGGSMIT